MASCSDSQLKHYGIHKYFAFECTRFFIFLRVLEMRAIASFMTSGSLCIADIIRVYAVLHARWMLWNAPEKFVMRKMIIHLQNVTLPYIFIIIWIVKVFDALISHMHSLMNLYLSRQLNYIILLLTIATDYWYPIGRRKNTSNQNNVSHLQQIDRFLINDAC